MKFNVYGRFLLEVQRENHTWAAYRIDSGRRARLDDVVLPAELGEAELARFLDDLSHELARPGDSVERVA